MGKVGDEWLDRVDRHFGFVRELGFRRVDVDDSQTTSLGGPWVDYRSDTAAIRVRQSYEDFRCSVILIRLKFGKLPPAEDWTGAGSGIASLDDVLEARRPDLRWLRRGQRGLSPKSLNTQLAFWSGVLRDVATDFLGGGFAVFDDAATVVRERIAKRSLRRNWFF